MSGSLPSEGLPLQEITAICSLLLMCSCLAKEFPARYSRPFNSVMRMLLPISLSQPASSSLNMWHLRQGTEEVRSSLLVLAILSKRLRNNRSGQWVTVENVWGLVTNAVIRWISYEVKTQTTPSSNWESVWRKPVGDCQGGHFSQSSPTAHYREIWKTKNPEKMISWLLEVAGWSKPLNRSWEHAISWGIRALSF